MLNLIDRLRHQEENPQETGVQSLIDYILNPNEDLVESLPYPTVEQMQQVLKHPEIIERFTEKEIRNFGGQRSYYTAMPFLGLPLSDAGLQKKGYELFLQIAYCKDQKRPRYWGRRDLTTALYNARSIYPLFQKRQNPFIEIGGPTDGWGYKYSPQPVIIGNYVPGIEVDFMMDARKMPFPDESIGAIFESCVPAKYPNEAERVLEPGGLWVRKATMYNEISINQENADGSWTAIVDRALPM